MADLITIARPYAKAAFEYAIEHGQVDKWEEMLTFASEVSQNDEMKSLLTSDMKPDALAKLFITVCKDTLDEFGGNFIKLMAENKRLILLPEVLTLFKQIRLDKEARVDVDVISASELTSTQLDKIQIAVEKRLSRKTTIKNTIDSSIISGFIIRAGDIVIDSSIRGRLNRLYDTLQS